jgi:hypothetical protein
VSYGLLGLSDEPDIRLSPRLSLPASETGTTVAVEISGNTNAAYYLDQFIIGKHISEDPKCYTCGGQWCQWCQQPSSSSGGGGDGSSSSGPVPINDQIQPANNIPFRWQVYVLSVTAAYCHDVPSGTPATNCTQLNGQNFILEYDNSESGSCEWTYDTGLEICSDYPETNDLTGQPTGNTVNYCRTLVITLTIAGPGGTDVHGNPITTPQILVSFNCVTTGGGPGSSGGVTGGATDQPVHPYFQYVSPDSLIDCLNMSGQAMVLRAGVQHHAPCDFNGASVTITALAD